MRVPRIEWKCRTHRDQLPLLRVLLLHSPRLPPCPPSLCPPRPFASIALLALCVHCACTDECSALPEGSAKHRMQRQQHRVSHKGEPWIVVAIDIYMSVCICLYILCTYYICIYVMYMFMYYIYVMFVFMYYIYVYIPVRGVGIALRSRFCSSRLCPSSAIPFALPSL